MKKSNKLALLASLVVALMAVTSTILALTMLFTKKRKEEKELERYLDCSIQ